MAKRKQHQQLQISENGVVSVSDIAARDTMPPCGTNGCKNTAMPEKKGSRKPKMAYGKPRCFVCNEAAMDCIRNLRNMGEDLGMNAVGNYINVNKDKNSVFDLAEDVNSLTEFIE